jgi:hypothetical protein
LISFQGRASLALMTTRRIPLPLIAAAFAAATALAASADVGARAAGASGPDVDRPFASGVPYELVLRVREKTHRRVEFLLQPDPGFRRPSSPPGTAAWDDALFASTCRVSQPVTIWGGYRVRLVESGEACVPAASLSEYVRGEGVAYCLEVYEPAQRIGGSPISIPVQLASTDGFTWGSARMRGLTDIRLAFRAQPWPSGEPAVAPCHRNPRGGRPDTVVAFIWPPSAIGN